MQANNAKFKSARTKAIKALVKPKIPNSGSCKLNQSTCLHRSPQAWETCLCLHCQGSQTLPAKGQDQDQGLGSNQGPGCS
ncbi:Hypothetical predicted protein [Lynx pardinus]|uniref:Uncharacterized protein n=1 Tax=Lynx pardinus TaxID=191816 RepID=A0A485N4I9_LYNPA|nr:Hypothetical predicted protein [Lynx pardinus]